MLNILERKSAQRQLFQVHRPLLSTALFGVFAKKINIYFYSKRAICHVQCAEILCHSKVWSKHVVGQ